MESEVKEKEKETRTNERGYTKDKQTHEGLEKDLRRFEGEMERLGYQEGHMEELQEKRCGRGKGWSMKG